MVKEFRDLLLRGNVVDLALAVVIGAAVGALITSFVTNLLTPLLGLLGGPDLATLTITTPGGAVIAYGLFLNALIAFILVALVIFFFVVKPMNSLEARRQQAEVDTSTTRTCCECATTIPLAAKRCPFCTQVQP